MNSYYQEPKERSAMNVNMLSISIFSFFISFMLLLSGCGGGGGGSSNAAKNTTPAAFNLPIESIALVSPTESGSINVVTGYPQKLLVVGINKNGTNKLLTSKDGLTFKIKESGYARVSESGIISGKVPGETSLTINLNNKIFLNNIKVKIDTTTLKSIKIYANNSNESSILLPEHFHVKLSAKGLFNDNVTRDISTYTGLWSSLNPSVAFESDTIYGTTLFSKKYGNTKITATQARIESGKEYNISVYVVNARLVNMSISPNNYVMPNNSKMQMNAIGTFSFESNAFNLDMTNNVLWSVDSSKATIDNSTGLLTTYESKGDVVVKAYSKLGESATARITIGNPVIESIYVTDKSGGLPIPTESEITIANGLTTNVYTYAIYSDGQTRPLDLKLESQCEWLNGTSGGQVEVTSMGNYSIVKALQQGLTYFTLSCQNSQNDTIQFTTNVLVTSAVVSSIAIDGRTILAKGETTPLTIIATYSDNKKGLISPTSITWEYNPTGIVEIVDKDQGILKAESKGKTLVTAKYKTANGNYISSSKEFQVNDHKLESINIDTTKSTIVAGTSQTLIAIGHYSDGESSNIAVNWNCGYPIKCNNNNNTMSVESNYNSESHVTINATAQAYPDIKSNSITVQAVPLAIVKLVIGEKSKCVTTTSGNICGVLLDALYNDGSIKDYTLPVNYAITPSGYSFWGDPNSPNVIFQYPSIPEQPVDVTATPQDNKIPPLGIKCIFNAGPCIEQ
ncbi:MAG: Ig-like domain-containing protein [Neisseriaceae bacterium]